MTIDRARAAYRILRSLSQRKHIFRWHQSLRDDYLLQTREPWLVFDAVDFLDSLHLENNRVFEYGSGASTLYWLKRGTNVVSVEHELEWYNRLRDDYLTGTSLEYRLVLPEATETHNLDPSDPDAYVSADERFPNHSFRSYCVQIDEFPDNYFDLVLIDGRARPSCIKHACTKTRIGGYVILDNSDRGYYLRRTAPLLRGYDRITFHGATPGILSFSETSVFVRRT